MSRLIRYLCVDSSATWKATAHGLVEAAAEASAEFIAVVDIPNEAHVVATMPLLRRGNDAALLRRKRLDREFPGTLLTTLLPFRHRPGDNSSDIVMVSVDSSGQFSAELSQLAEQHSLRGVYTPALLAGVWISRARQTSRRVLVVMPTPAGLRLIFVDGGKPLLSRLMPANGGEATEIARTVQYLHNTQRVEREQSVELWFWGMSRAQIDACLPASGACHEGQVPVVAGLPDPVEGGFTALLAMAAARPPWAQLAPMRLRAGWHARQVNRWALGLAASVLLMGSGLALLWGRESAALRQETQALQTQMTELAASRSNIDSRLAVHKLDLDGLLLLPEAAALLQRSSVPLPEMLSLAGRIFGSHAAVQLESLDLRLASPVPVAGQTGHECATETVTADATLEARFSLAVELDVRRHAEALAHVRQEMARSAPWQPTIPSTQIGESSPLAIRAGVDDSGEKNEWSICLTRAGAA